MSSTTAAHTPALSRDAGRVLEILRKRFGAARVEELAKATDLSKAEVLEVLCDLESDGLVESVGPVNVEFAVLVQSTWNFQMRTRFV